MSNHTTPTPYLTYCITIEQLESDGAIFRTFHRHPRNEAELDAALHSITYAYHLASTRVTVRRPDGTTYDPELVR